MDYTSPLGYMGAPKFQGPGTLIQTHAMKNQQICQTGDSWLPTPTTVMTFKHPYTYHKTYPSIQYINMACKISMTSIFKHLKFTYRKN